MNLRFPSFTTGKFNADTAAKLLTAGLFVVLCVQAGQWLTAWLAPSKISLPAQSQVAQVEPTQTGMLRSLFGGSMQGAQNSNIQLKGVVAVGGAGNTGAAILSIDGKPPEAIRVGRELAPQIKLVAVEAKSVTIERNGVRETIKLPEPTPSATPNTQPLTPAASIANPSISAVPARATSPVNTAAMEAAVPSFNSTIAASPRPTNSGGMVPLGESPDATRK